MASTVDPVAHLPTLSLPLQGGDLCPMVATKADALLFAEVFGLLPESFPWRGVERNGSQVRELFHPLFLSFSLWRRDSGPWRSSETTQSSDRAPCPLRPGAEQGRQPRRVPPGDANAGSECRLVRLFPSPSWPLKEGTRQRVISVGSLHRGTSSCTSFYGSVQGMTSGTAHSNIPD